MAPTSRGKLTFPSGGEESELRGVPVPSPNVRRLSDIQSASGADMTLRNLLEAAGARLELRSRLAIHEYEAHVEGHEAAARAFGELAAAEQAACCELLRHLRRHLDEMFESREAEPSSRAGRDTD